MLSICSVYSDLSNTKDEKRGYELLKHINAVDDFKKGLLKTEKSFTND